jgi:hypothetical protein
MFINIRKSARRKVYKSACRHIGLRRERDAIAIALTPQRLDLVDPFVTCDDLTSNQYRTGFSPSPFLSFKRRHMQVLVADIANIDVQDAIFELPVTNSIEVRVKAVFAHPQVVCVSPLLSTTAVAEVKWGV